MLVMLMAMITVHFEHGWLAIAHESSEATARLNGFMQWLEQAHPGRFSHIVEHGHPVILNNGLEFSVTYFIMLLSLFFTGSGRFLSIDYWLKRKWSS
jgi:uncharacterized membrane protein YphA (DoxX/SURF4 family)